MRASSSSIQAAGRVLAIDYGRRRIGLAISDELGVTARPLETLERKNRDTDLRRLRGLVREHSVRRIVVGNPVHLDGTASEMAEEAVRFARRIERQLGLSVELVDERLSSWEAEQIAPQKHSRTKRASSTDHVAAAVILRDYLERTRAAKPRGKARG